jgi:hypothetical protein
MTKLRPYAQSIAGLCGTEDTATLDLIEALMRDDNGGVLDSLTPAQFGDAIVRAIAGVAELAAGGHLALYCEGMGIAVPVAGASR